MTAGGSYGPSVPTSSENPRVARPTGSDSASADVVEADSGSVTGGGVVGEGSVAVEEDSASVSAAGTVTDGSGSAAPEESPEARVVVEPAACWPSGTEDPPQAPSTSATASQAGALSQRLPNRDRRAARRVEARRTPNSGRVRQTAKQQEPMRIMLRDASTLRVAPSTNFAGFHAEPCSGRVNDRGVGTSDSLALRFRGLRSSCRRNRAPRRWRTDPSMEQHRTSSRFQRLPRFMCGEDERFEARIPRIDSTTPAIQDAGLMKMLLTMCNEVVLEAVVHSGGMQLHWCSFSGIGPVLDGW